MCALRSSAGRAGLAAASTMQIAAQNGFCNRPGSGSLAQKIPDALGRVRTHQLPNPRLEVVNDLLLSRRQLDILQSVERIEGVLALLIGDTTRDVWR